MAQRLTKTDLEDIANGACIYASGGGGSVKMAEPLIDAIMESGSVELIELEEVGDREMLAVSAGAGSPDAATASEVVKDLAIAATNAFKSLGQQVGGDELLFKYSVAIETGIGNTLLPMIVAARCQIPVINGAGSRRSVPTLPMCTFASHGMAIAPVVLTNQTDKIITYQVEPPGEDGGAAAAQGPMGAILSTEDFGNIGGISFWPMTGRQAKASTTPGTVADALKLGQTLRQAKNEAKDPVAAVCEAMGGYILLRRGRLESRETQTSGSLDFVKVVFQNLDDSDSDKYFRIYALNESLIAWSDDLPYPVAMGPDLICYLTGDGEVFSNADLDLVKDKEIAIIGAPAQESLRIPSIVDSFLSILHGLGYGGPYVPIEALQKLSTPDSEVIAPLPRKRFSQVSAQPPRISWRG